MWGLAGFVLGLVLGSFIKVLADRSLNNKTFLGRSYCPYCKHKLQWYDLLPIFSYLYLGGKCRYCRHKIPLEYLVLEIVSGFLIGFLFWQSGQSFQFPVFNFQFSIFVLDLLFKTFFVSILISLFLTDLKKMLIPDRIALPAIVISVIYLVSLTFYKVGYLYYYLSQSLIGQKLLTATDYFQRHSLIDSQDLFSSVLSAMLIAGFFMGLIILTKGKGMGGGDVKLGALMGLGLGFPSSLLALMLAFLSGSFVSIGLLLFRRKKFGSQIAFGPFLVLGSLIALFWGQKILDWYVSLRP